MGIVGVLQTLDFWHSRFTCLGGFQCPEQLETEQDDFLLLPSLFLLCLSCGTHLAWETFQSILLFFLPFPRVAIPTLCYTDSSSCLRCWHGSKCWILSISKGFFSRNHVQVLCEYSFLSVWCGYFKLNLMDQVTQLPI